jgi:dynein heavy chain
MPKVLFTPMKSIWIIPKTKKEINRGHTYKCPIYKTAERRGTLSTSGHNTNFVEYTYLPMQKKHQAKHWTKRGVALLTGLSD